MKITNIKLKNGDVISFVYCLHGANSSKEIRKELKQLNVDGLVEIDSIPHTGPIFYNNKIVKSFILDVETIERITNKKEV